MTAREARKNRTSNGKYPITADDVNRQYAACAEADDFYEWTAFENDEVVGHMIMRFPDAEKKRLRFGFVIVDDTKRGRGYGSGMLRLALLYAFEILRVEKVMLGVFENNEPAYQCYQSVGFETVALENPESYHVMGEDWKCIEMEMTRQKFVNMTN